MRFQGYLTRSKPPLGTFNRQVVEVRRGDGAITTRVIADVVSGFWAKLACRGEPLAQLADAIVKVDPNLAHHWAFGGDREEGGTVELQLPGDTGLAEIQRVGIYPLGSEDAIIVIDSVSHYLTQFSSSVVAGEWARVHAEYGLFSFIVEADTERILYLSPQMESITGVSRAEILADPKNWMRGVIPADLPLVAPFYSAVRTKGVASADLRVRDSRGLVLTLRYRCTIVLDHEPRLIIGVCRDVSETVALNDQARTLLRGIEQSREGFLVTNALGKVVYMNRETVKMFGLGSAQSALGRSWEELHDLATVALIKSEAMPELARTGSWAGNVTICREGEAEQHQSMVLSVMPDGSVVWSSRNCADEVSMRTRLMESERLFHNVVEHLPSGLLIKHLDGRYAYINPRAREFVTSDALATRKAVDPHNLLPPPIIGQSDHDLLASELADRIRAADQTVAVTKRTLIEDFQGTIADAGRIFNAVRFPVLDEHGQVWRVATLLNDVTWQRQLERDMKDLVERRGQLLTMQREFVSLASHEFRTPLAALQGTLYLLRKHLNPESGAKVSRYLELQTNALATLKELVDQVLLLNRIEHATSGAKLAEGDLMDLLRRVRLEFNDSTSEPRVQLEGPESGICPLRLDESLMRAAIDNLVSNALKYSPAGTEVVVALAPTATGWRISVQDRGHGVPEADQARLFQPFFRASNVGTTSGTGLGLTIVKRAAELHGGSAGFTSCAGSGSTFFIDLPAPEDSPVTGPARQPQTTENHHAI